MVDIETDIPINVLNGRINVSGNNENGLAYKNNNEKQNFNKLSLNYQFTHEYKKVQFNDPMNNDVFGEVYDFVSQGQGISDQNRFIEQENKLTLSSNSEKIGKLKLSYSLTNWVNSFKIYENQNVDESIFELDEDQSNISIEWTKIFKKYSFR